MVNTKKYIVKYTLTSGITRFSRVYYDQKEAEEFATNEKFKSAEMVEYYD